MNVSGMLYIVYNENYIASENKGGNIFPKCFNRKQNFFCNAMLQSEYLKFVG